MIRVWEDELDKLVRLARRAEARTLDAAACGTSYDRQRAHTADDELGDYLDELIKRGAE